MNTVTFKGKPVKVEGTFPSAGEKAPDFILVNHKLENQSLKDFSGENKLLLIVPSLETPVCATCTKKFHETLQAHKHVDFLVISADLPFAQKRYIDQEKLKGVTTLSMMRNQSFALDYGVLIKDGPLQGLCVRATLVLNKTNTTLYSEMVSDITSEHEYDTALSYLS